MKYILPFVLLWFTSLPLLAQTGEITGSVKDTKGKPLEFINVMVVDSQLGTITDFNGDFIIKAVPSGPLKLSFSSLGYIKQVKDLALKPGQIIHLEVNLKESEVTLQTVEILGRSETSYRNNSSFIGTKSATALKDVPQSIGYVTKELALDQGAFRVNDVVKNISGVNQFTFYNDITIRGHRIQGQKTSGNLVNGMRAMTSFWKQQLIPHIERVEVIKGPASALFGNASAGGTINRVTKKPLKESRQEFGCSSLLFILAF